VQPTMKTNMPTSNIMAVFFTVLALTMGLPTPDAESDAFDMASHEVTVLLQQGKDESACADLAKSLIDEVTNKVDSANKLLADLDDGSDCSSKGQDAVTTATTNKENAEKAATEAASAASSAAATEVDMGSYSFSALTEGTCTQFWSDPSYTAAQKTAADAATAQTDADAEVKAAESSLQAAQEQAAKDVKTCQCAVRTSYDTAFAEATKKASDDAAAFTKGRHMECVLKGTPAADCKVGDVPAVTPITLAEGVPDKQCIPEDGTQKPEGTCNFLYKDENGSSARFWTYSAGAVKFKYQLPSWKATNGWSTLAGTANPFPGWYKSQKIPLNHPIITEPQDVAVFDFTARSKGFVRMVNANSPPVNEIPSPPTSAEEANKLMKPNCFDKKM